MKKFLMIIGTILVLVMMSSVLGRSLFLNKPSIKTVSHKLSDEVLYLDNFSTDNSTFRTGDFMISNDSRKVSVSFKNDTSNECSVILYKVRWGDKKKIGSFMVPVGTTEKNIFDISKSSSTYYVVVTNKIGAPTSGSLEIKEIK